jgi:hypothetical protein
VRNLSCNIHNTKTSFHKGDPELSVGFLCIFAESLITGAKRKRKKRDGKRPKQGSCGEMAIITAHSTSDDQLIFIFELG